jgi:hypothetical protein
VCERRRHDVTLIDAVFSVVSELQYKQLHPNKAYLITELQQPPFFPCALAKNSLGRPIPSSCHPTDRTLPVQLQKNHRKLDRSSLLMAWLRILKADSVRFNARQLARYHPTDPVPSVLPTNREFSSRASMSPLFLERARFVS